MNPMAKRTTVIPIHLPAAFNVAGEGRERSVAERLDAVVSVTLQSFPGALVISTFS